MGPCAQCAGLGFEFCLQCEAELEKPEQQWKACSVFAKKFGWREDSSGESCLRKQEG